MFKKMMVLAMLLPGAGGCFWGVDGGGRGHGGGGWHEGHGGGGEHRGNGDTMVIAPVHVHVDGCGHVLRDGVWVDSD
jgi:hypothetical protein